MPRCSEKPKNLGPSLESQGAGSKEARALRFACRYVRVMAKTDFPTEILIQIRDEMKATRAELSATREQLSSKIDQTNSRLERVERAQSETEVRLATELINVVSAVNQLKDQIVADRDLRHKVDEHDRRIAGSREHHAS